MPCCFQHLEGSKHHNILFPFRNTAISVASRVAGLPTKLPVSLTSSGSVFWSWSCIPLVSETKHWICCSILVILQWFMETSRTAIYRFTFCLSRSVQSVLTHCPSNLISHAAFKCRARPWPLSGGWQLSDTDSRLQILAAKTHSFIPVTDHCPQLETMLYSPPISWQEIYILY